MFINEAQISKGREGHSLAGLARPILADLATFLRLGDNSPLVEGLGRGPHMIARLAHSREALPKIVKRNTIELGAENGSTNGNPSIRGNGV